MRPHKLALILAAGSAWLASAVFTPALAGKTLDAIKQRDQVVCGVNTGLAGFGAADSQGKWTGLDVDMCRAMAAAVLGSADKVRYVPLSAPQRFTALQSGEVDVLSRNTTFTLTASNAQGSTSAQLTVAVGSSSAAGLLLLATDDLADDAVLASEQQDSAEEEPATAG